jgi:hypothetical protein
VSVWAALALFDAAVAVAIVGQWASHWRAPARSAVDGAGWRPRALSVSVLMTGAAALLELLQALDEASRQGGSAHATAIAALCCIAGAGVLSIGGVVAAIAGAGPSRTSTIGSSVAMLLAFLLMLLFAVNSFH